MESMGGNVQFRLPLIPGFNDSDDNIRDTAEFVKNHAITGTGIQLMPYHRAGHSKYDALDMVNETAGLGIMKTAEILSIKEKFASFDIECTIST